MDECKKVLHGIGIISGRRDATTRAKVYSCKLCVVDEIGVRRDPGTQTEEQFKYGSGNFRSPTY